MEKREIEITGGTAVTVRLATVAAWPSSAASCNWYVPGAEKFAVVAAALAFPKATAPGPLISLQPVVKVEEEETVAERAAEFGKIIV